MILPFIKQYTICYNRATTYFRVRFFVRHFASLGGESKLNPQYIECVKILVDNQTGYMPRRTHQIHCLCTVDKEEEEFRRKHDILHYS